MSSDGNIYGTPTAADTFSVTVTVTDSDDNTDTKDFSLLIAPPVQITTTTLVDGTVGVAYSQEVDATGGRQPYSWLCTDLPPGLSISSLTVAPGNSSAMITGTPTDPGTYTCHVTVTDAGSFTSNSSSDSKTFTITIDAAPLSITTTALSDGNVGNDYSDQVEATGGTPPYTWSATDLPPGLDISSSDGTIDGTPTTEGDYSPNFTVADSGSPTQKTASKNIPIKIKSLTLAGPTRIGQVKNPKGVSTTATAQTYTVTVSNQNDASSVKLKKTLNSTGDVDISAPTVQGTTVTFTVKGLAGSDPGQKNDVTLTATSDANPTGDSINISVVIPTAIGTPHQQGPINGVAVKNMLLSKTSFPPTPPNIPAPPANTGWACIVIQANTTVKVVDQYGAGIGDIYPQAPISEDSVPSNTNLQADSTYTDPLGGVAPAIDSDGFAYTLTIGSQAANNFLAQPSTPVNDTNWVDANTPVEVDGFSSGSGITGRTVRTQAPATLEVKWP